MVKKRRFQFQYDVALSFARQDRPRAELVARAMQSLGLRVFYDRDHHAHLWGKKRTAFEHIYGPASAFVVPFISKHYAHREWTQWEFETAKREARERSTDFLLPIRIDESRQFGLTDDHNYLRADDFTPDEIAHALKDKLDAEYSRRPPTHNRPGIHTVLTLDARRALGLIATAPMSLTVGYLHIFFPAIDWTKHIRRFRTDQLIREDGVMIAAVKGIERSFENEIVELKGIWATKLEELSDHCDCALFLSLHYVGEGRFDDAVLALGSLASAMEPNRWLVIYTDFLKVLSNAKVWRKLKPTSRLVFHLGYGHCLLASGRLKDARGQYQKLRRAGRQLNDAEAVGLALLNIGVTYHKAGEFEFATTWYQSAREYGIKHRQLTLTSYALHNLAQIALDDNPHKAIVLLEQSIEIKNTNDDSAGVAASLQVLAVAYAELQDFEESISHYERAEEIATGLDLRHLRSHLLNNKAHTLLQRGSNADAMRTFKKALKIADAEGFSELQVRSTEGICQIHFMEGRLDEAAPVMLHLSQLAALALLPEFELVAHHGLWAVYSLKGDTTNATRHFTILIRLARKLKSYEWLVRAIVDKSKPVGDKRFQLVDPNRLRQLIRAESRRNDDVATGWLWQALANNVEDTDEGIAALLNSIESFGRASGMANDILDAYEQIYVLQWESGRVDDAIATLDSVARLAKQYRIGTREIAAIDQKGFCLQQRHKYTDALKLHKCAAMRARSMGLFRQVVTSLHNLAECHRRSGNAASAIAVFQDAMAEATAMEDEEAVVQLLHGKALSLETLGDYEDADVLLKECQSRSSKSRFWREYVRACHAVANLSWIRGRLTTAVRQFESALSACKEHGVYEEMSHIAYNLALLWRLLGRAAKARQLLAQYIDLVFDPFELAQFHRMLAELCTETRKPADAQKHWRIAIASAEAIGNDDTVTLCKSGYEQFERLQRRPDVKALEDRLKVNLSAEDRAITLKDLVDARLKGRSSRLATEALSLAQQHMKEHGFRAHLIDLYMLVFEHNWNGNRESRLNALQAYVGAFATAAEPPERIDDCGQIFNRVMMKVSERGSAPPLRQLAWLDTQFNQWLSDQLGEGNDLIPSLMMPLRFAAKLIPFNNNPVRFLEEIERFNREELELK